jgi:hypothetical protein
MPTKEMIMKKLVTVFALCAGLSAYAVESANVVGYQTINIPAGFSASATTFVTVGGDGTKCLLGDIKGNAAFHLQSIQLLSSDGAGSVILTATYFDGLGWFDNNDNLVNNTELKKGEAFIVSTGATGATLTFMGEVRATTFSVAIANGFTLMGNSLPRDITLGEITANAAFHLQSIQLLSSDGTGSVILTATYFDGLGWFDNNDNLVNSTIINSSSSFVVSTGVTGAQLIFPAAL